jgi:hypothetical protein
MFPSFTNAILRCMLYKPYLSIEHSALLETPKELRFQEFAYGDVLCKTLPSPCLEHEVACELLCGRRLEWSGCDVLVKRIAGYDRPAIEDEGKGDLALCVDLW